MANITPIKNKDGTTSYRIRVYKGRDAAGKPLKPYTMIYKPAAKMTEKQIKKELEKQAVLFEEQCKKGYVSQNKQTFEQYSAYVLDLKKRNGLKETTYTRYKELLKRINAGIGYLKITEIRPQHLNSLYEQLASKGIRLTPNKAKSKADIKAIIKQQALTQEEFCSKADISIRTLQSLVKGNYILAESANKIADALDMTVNDLFVFNDTQKPLSNKTILEHHRLISTILEQAEKEMLILFNPAHRATPPKSVRPEVNYFQVDDIQRINECLINEPIKWRLFVHLLMITGCRRGEIAGLQWKNIDFDKRKINIIGNLIYTKDKGVFLDTPKTKNSVRCISVPDETISLIKDYKLWQIEQIMLLGSKWQRTDFVFCKDNGLPINPQSITAYLNKFSKKYDLPHINPHAFRHTMASVLNEQGIDIVTISKRLGHSKVSTTMDIYSHIMQKADENASDCIASVFLNSKKQEQNAN